MITSAYEWHGPFKYDTNGEGFRYGNRYFRTALGRKRDTSFQAFDRIYGDDELYARRIRASNNLAGFGYSFEIFDELPEGWHVGIYFHDCRSGLRSHREDRWSKYLWCETDVPMFRNAYPGDSRRNPEYRQALVRNPRWHE